MSAYLVIAVVVAGLLLLRLGSRLSQAGKLSRPLQALVGSPVRVQVWGEALEGELRVESVMAIGAGLHLYLVPASGKRTHLKIAQPGRATGGGDRWSIGFARYVEWRRRRLSRADDPAVPAVVLEKV